MMGGNSGRAKGNSPPQGRRILRRAFPWVIRAAIAGFLIYKVSDEAGTWTGIAFLIIWLAYVALHADHRRTREMVASHLSEHSVEGAREVIRTHGKGFNGRFH
jgi:hypothetical protein